jgi:hypothetical protein
MDLLSGYKTYLAAAGPLGLALYQFSQGQVELNEILKIGNMHRNDWKNRLV